MRSDVADGLLYAHSRANSNTAKDVEEGIVQWEFGHPYFIAQGEDGYCRDLDRGCMGCSIHKNRPVPCRGYDCRKDARIWSDFEQRIVSPELDKLFASNSSNTGT
jgi:hypothetical protein